MFKTSSLLSLTKAQQDFSPLLKAVPDEGETAAHIRFLGYAQSGGGSRSPFAIANLEVVLKVLSKIGNFCNAIVIKPILTALFCLIVIDGVAGSSLAQVNILTQHNDNFRTGTNPSETTLTPSNVTVNTFGKLFTRYVDGQIYTQPLYVANLAFSGKGTHNAVFVGTQHNSVYAFDADDPNQFTPLWTVNLGPSVPSADLGPSYSDIYPEVGITSTPVIDLGSQTIYVVNATKVNGVYFHRLHALDLQTGQEKFGGPVNIQATVPSTGSNEAVNGQISFVSKQQVQRTALALANGMIVFGFASYGDNPPYWGWVFAYDSQTLQQRGVFNDATDAAGGGIWQSGQGFSVDASGDVYVASGNHITYQAIGPNELSESVFKLRPSAGLALVDWFKPYDYAALDAVDNDLGIGGVVLIPGSNLAYTGSKEGKLYLLDQNNLGHIQYDDVQIPQSFQATQSQISGSAFCRIFGSPALWNGPNGYVIFVWGENDYLKSYQFLNTDLFNTTPVSKSTMTAPLMTIPGGAVSVSSNGNQGGIVWASVRVDASTAGYGMIRAFDANNLGHELWDSEQNSPRDTLGLFAKFVAPTVVNGKVYMPSASGQLVAYGLNPVAVSNSVMVTSPLPNSTVTLPVQILAAGQASVPISQLQAWIDGKKVAYQAGSYMNQTVATFADGSKIPDGVHTLEVIELDNNYTKINTGLSGTLTFTSNSSSGGGTSITITTPTANSTVGSPLHIVASGKATVPISQLQVWIDRKKVGAYITSSIDISVTNFQDGSTIAAGSHFLEVIELDSSYHKIDTGTTGDVNFVLATSGNSISISSPSANSNVASPIHIAANGSATVFIAQIQVWIDGKKVTWVQNSSIDVQVTKFEDGTTIAPGKHLLQVIELDNQYHVIDTGGTGTEYFTLQ